MAYTPQNFEDGKVLQAEELNHIEAGIAEIEKNLKEKQPAGNYIETETDPTVPAWAKEPTKPTYTATEVGARPATWTPSAEDVGADPSGTAETKVSEHNTNAEAHNDIRLLISGLTTRLNALANSDDITLDQMAEVVAYIKSNRTLIESVTTDKVSVTDIIDNLTTNVANKPLSAAQGVVLKGLIDTLQTALNNHITDGTAHITAAERTAWNNKQPAGNYATKEELPTKTSQLTDDVGFAKQEEVDSLSEEIADYLIEPIPSYWVSELETKANEIQIAMEEAGSGKSAFLWYTDAHWDAGNSKMSPRLLKYLYYNTPMNKVNFGGDIVGDPTVLTHETAKHLYSTWRKQLKGLPNHHSVLGNHDNFYATNLTYTYLIAPEETSDMVMSGEFYYYIDNPCERTRYLYLDSGKHTLTDYEAGFIIDALTSTPASWHIVVISHIWFQYTSASNPSVGSMNVYMQKALNLFDAYNARQSGSITMVSNARSYDFTSCDGRVEFCIGGHIHIDLDLSSNDGIPVIITASDVNQERSGNETEDSGTLGTITESAVYGIVADYAKNQVTVVGVGRGGSRVVELQTKHVVVTNYADPTSSDWLTGYRLSTSATSSTGNTADIVTNYIPCKYGDIVTIEGLNVKSYSGGNARYHMCKDDKSLAVGDAGYVNDLITKGFASINGNVTTIQAGYIGSTGSYTNDSKLQRFCGQLMDGYTANDVVINVTKAI